MASDLEVGACKFARGQYLGTANVRDTPCWGRERELDEAVADLAGVYGLPDESFGNKQDGEPVQNPDKIVSAKMADQ
jgi:hypothetical protein